MNVLSCDKITIQIGHRLILSDLTFTLDYPQFIGIFGPNGAGKTSFMKTILGMLPVKKGNLQILGKTPKQARKYIGYVPQQQEIDSFHLTGKAFIASSIRGHWLGLPLLTKQDRYEIDRVLEYVDAKDLAIVALDEMSGGQRQRILLAQALLNNPKFIILDEPFNHLDPKWVQIILSLLKNIQQERKITILLSTHDLNPLTRVMDQVICIGNGRAVLGKVDEVITTETLTRLYDFPIHVLSIDQTRFVTTSFN